MLLIKIKFQRILDYLLFGKKGSQIMCDAMRNLPTPSYVIASSLSNFINFDLDNPHNKDIMKCTEGFHDIGKLEYLDYLYYICTILYMYRLGKLYNCSKIKMVFYLCFDTFRQILVSFFLTLTVKFTWNCNSVFCHLFPLGTGCLKKNGTQTNVNNPLVTKISNVKFAHNKPESVQFMHFKGF